MSVKGDIDFKMLRALYDFTATLSQTLSFEKDQLFIFHSSNNIKKNWWSVINDNGKHGYIPSNYVTVIQASREEYLAFVYILIEKIGKEIARDGGTSGKSLELMQELISKRQSIETLCKTKSIGVKEKFTSSKSLPSSTNIIEAVPKKDANTVVVPPPPLRTTQSESEVSLDLGGKTATDDSSGMKVEVQTMYNSIADSSDVDPVPSIEEKHSDNFIPQPSINATISTDALYSLIQQVREETGLSFDLSKLAVGVVCEGLSQCSGMQCFMQRVLDALRSPLSQPKHRLENTPDAISLFTALSHLATCHDDAQQRSWQLWDDEHSIISNIELAINVLENADPEISKLVLKSDNYEKINILLEYYQMEERWTIRDLLITAFTAMSSLDNTAISVLLNSVLPMELSREMEANLKNSGRITKLAKLLTVVFSTGEPMPITHVEHLGSDFVKLVLSLIEDEDDCEVGDVMLTLLLSYNLQFKPGSTTNIVVQSLYQVDHVKIFTEKILLLLNREEDPVKCLKVNACSHHSVLKLFMDIFSGPTASKLFYTNDIRVLVDIVIRQLTDLPPHNEKRTEYLCLCKLVLMSCDEICYDHRHEELLSILIHILTEEVPVSEPDRKIVRDIFSALPAFFGQLSLD